jgi:ABC-type transporter Mla MlaB component
MDAAMRINDTFGKTTTDCSGARDSAYPGDDARVRGKRVAEVPLARPGIAQIELAPSDGVHQRESVWADEVTWREVAALREDLFDQLEFPECVDLRLDVRRVTAIDTPGIALLIGANHRATATGRRLELIDANGPVTAALVRKHMLRDFRVTQVIAAVTAIPTCPT